MKYFDRKHLRQYYVSLLRQSGTPETIAKSAAIGLFVGFFFPIGTQVPAALLLAMVFRAKKILALVFTLPTNPYTIFFIYPVQCWIGGKICGIPLRLGTLRTVFHGLRTDFSFGEFLELSVDIIAAFFAGGLLFGVLSGVIGYFAVYGIIMSYRQRAKTKLATRLISKHRE